MNRRQLETRIRRLEQKLQHLFRNRADDRLLRRFEAAQQRKARYLARYPGQTPIPQEAV